MLPTVRTIVLPLWAASAGVLTGGSARMRSGNLRPSALVPIVWRRTTGARFASASQKATTSAWREVALYSLFSATVCGGSARRDGARVRSREQDRQRIVRTAILRRSDRTSSTRQEVASATALRLLP